MNPLSVQDIKDAEAALRIFRNGRGFMHYMDHGLWLSARNQEGDNQCRICGYPSPLVWDHCHITGLTRGLICQSCNTLEPRRPDHPIFNAWRQCAPELAVGMRNIQGHEGRAHGLTDEQLLTLPIHELLTLAETEV